MKLNKIWKLKNKKGVSFHFSFSPIGLSIALMGTGIIQSNAQAPADLYPSGASTLSTGQLQNITNSNSSSGFQLNSNSILNINSSDGSSLLTGRPNVIMSVLGGSSPTINITGSNETFSSLISSSAASNININGNTLTIDATPQTSTLPPFTSIGSNDTYTGIIRNTTSGTQFGRLVVQGSSDPGNTVIENMTFSGPIDFTGALTDSGLDNDASGVVDEDDFNVVVGNGVNVNFQNSSLSDTTALSVNLTSSASLSGGETITDLWVQGSGSTGTFNPALNNGALTINSGTFSVTDAAVIDGILNVASGAGLVSLANPSGAGQANLNGNDLDISVATGTTSISSINFLGVNDLTLSGPGILTLNTAGTHTGITTLAGGGVIANDPLAFSSGNVVVSAATDLSGDVTLANNFMLNDTLTINENTGATSLSGDISGIGGFTHNGAGIVNLTGNNTFTGALNVLQGTANISNSTVVSLINVNSAILNHTGNATTGDVTIDQTSTATFGNDLSGTSLLVDNASGLTVGGTLSGMSLLLDNTSNTAITGDAIVNTITLDNTSTLAINGNTSATTLNTQNSSSTTISGNATIDTINADNGSVNVNGVTDSDLVNISNGGSVSLDGAATVDLANVTSGTFNSNNTLTSNIINVSTAGVTNLGGVTNVTSLGIASGGIVNTTGANIISDNASVIVNGILNLGGLDAFNTLSGNGTIVASSGLTTASGTTVNPGNSNIGALNVTGDYNQSGIYNAEVLNTSTSDTINVSGAVTIDRNNAVLNVTDSGTDLDTLGATTNVISASGGITGGYSAVNELSSTSRLVFDIATGNVVSLGVNTFTDPTYTENQTAVLSGLTPSILDGDNIDTASTAGSAFNSIVLQSGANLKANLDAFSPEGYLGAVDYSLQSLNSYSNAVRSSAPISIICDDDLNHAYRGASSNYAAPDGCALEVLGGWNSFTGGSDISTSGNDYDLSGNGGYLGVRLCGYDRVLKLGLYGAYDTGDSSSANIDLEASGFLFGGFVDIAPKDMSFVFHGDLSYGVYSFDGTHNFAGNSNSSSFDANALKVSGSIDYILTNRTGVKLLPTIGLTHLSTSADSFTEQGPSANLNVTDLSASSTLFDVGLKFELVGEGQYVGLTGYVGYQHDLGETEREVSAEFVGNPFTVSTEGASAGAAIYNVGAYWNATDTIRFNANYYGETRADAQTSSGFSLGANLSF